MTPVTSERQISPGEMRATLGRFCTGVTVISTADGEGEQVHAMTANAFTSVSLDPPLVLVSLGHGTRMHELLPQSARYGVSVLRAEQERIALHFAGRPLAGHGELFEWADGIPYVCDAIAQIGCSLYGSHEAGDHTIHLGQVERLHSRAGKPLLFHLGEFGQMSSDEEVRRHGWGW